MSRSLRIFLGLAVPSLSGLLLLALISPAVKQMPDIDPKVVLIMLGFIVTSVLSSVFTAFAFSGITFTKKRDILLLYLNSYPWVLFIVLFFSRFWVLILPILFTPLLGYWFAKRFFSL
jgi:predicted Na+-dependent transporter